MARFTPGPGKSAPRLIEDLLDHDPRSKLSKNGRSLLADPAPQYIPGALAPLRKGINDCRHSLMRKNKAKEEGSTDVPVSTDQQPDIHSKYIVDSYCIHCRYNFHIKVSFASSEDGPVICHLSDVDNPMHHLRLSSSMRGEEWRAMIGTDAFKYDPLTESHQFVCTARHCPALVEIRISPPRLSLKLLAPILDNKLVWQRGQAQIREEPSRYVGQNAVSTYLALGYLRTYLNDARSSLEVKRIAKRNKKYRLAFGDECNSLLEYLGFVTTEEDDETEGPTYFWQLPVITNQNKKFIDDCITELEVLIKKAESARTMHAPIPALKDIEMSLGYHEYLTRKRVIDVDTVEHPYYASLGACENFTDELLIWAYDRQRECDPANKPYYLDCLIDLAHGRGSPDLQMKVAIAESAGEHGLQAIKDAYKFFALDASTVEGDDHIMGLFKSRIESAPRQKDEARRCLLVIAKQRGSAEIESLANDRTMTFEEALEFLNVSADTASDSIEASAIAMSLDADKSKVAGALRVISNRRPGDFTLQRAAASMESGSSESTLDIGEAYNRLQIQQRNMPDETILTYYQSLAKGAPSGSQDSYKEALRVIALDRQSNFLLRKLEDPEADVQASTAEPVGLDNIGNTCYLNSLLQYYYTVKPVRDMVIDFETHRMVINEENLKKKRAGGRIIEQAEIIKAQTFVEELHGLFENLKTASTRSVRPTKQLAELTIFSTEKEEIYRRKSISSPQGPPTISSVLDGAVYGPQWPPPSVEAPRTPEEDIEMVDRPTDKGVDAGDDSSEATLVEMDQLPPLIDTSEKNSVESAVEGTDMSVDQNNNDPESTNDLGGDAVMVNGNDSPKSDTPSSEKPPPIPPRNKSGLVISTTENKKIIADNDFWRFGVQQDVTEVMNNVIFRLQCAIKPTSIEAASGEQLDVITKTFYGANTTYTQKAQSLVKKTEAWSNLIVFPGEGPPRDIYEAIDVVYDEQAVDVENSSVPQWQSMSTVPPIFQIQIQRTAYAAERGSFKNRTPLIFPETIYLDRYLDTEDPDSTLMRRRRETWKWKAKLRTLEARQATLRNSKGQIPVTEALLATRDYLKGIQEEEIEGIEINDILPEVLDERISEVAGEQEELAEQIAALRQKLQNQFTDMRQYEYKLQSVFIHRGEAGGGHYWIYIYDFEHDIWREYNDEYVSEVQDRRRIFEDQGAAGNPYFLVYVRSQDKAELVDAVCRDVQETQEVQMADVEVWDDGNGESEHIEHVKPRPLRPKSKTKADLETSNFENADWEKDWPPAAENGTEANGLDANGNPW